MLEACDVCSAHPLWKQRGWQERREGCARPFVGGAGLMGAPWMYLASLSVTQLCSGYHSAWYTTGDLGR